MISVYGIKTCSTVKKALNWLAQHHIDATLQDFRVDGVSAEFLQQAMDKFGWQALVNKRSTTWRTLDQEIKDNLNQDNVLAVLLANPTLIKRPIILHPPIALLGFDEKAYAEIFLGEK